MGQSQGQGYEISCKYTILHCNANIIIFIWDDTPYHDLTRIKWVDGNISSQSNESTYIVLDIILTLF